MAHTSSFQEYQIHQKLQAKPDERGETRGVSNVFLRIARKSILFEQKT
jgi:hypothetical protein